MQQVIQRGRRQFAVPKPLSLTDRVAAATNLRGNWSAIMRSQTSAKVVLNYHRR